MNPRIKRHRREEIWERALARAHLGVWDWDLVTGDCFYSATWAEMLGYSEGELPARSDLWLELTHPDDRERAIASGEKHLAGLSDIIETELRLKHKAGHWVWVLDRGGVVERDADGKPLRMIGVQTDISRQKAAEHQLAQVNARFRLALTASGIGIWHHDIDSSTSFWDAGTRQIFGIETDSDELPSDLWQTYLHPDDKEETELAHSAPIGTQDVVAVRYRIVRRDGEVRYVESLVRYIPDTQSSGQLLGTVRDVTEKQKRERELAYAAEHDPLTGLLNRSAFDNLLSRAIASGREMRLAVFYIDIDYFKALNDLSGHAAGDLALQRIAAQILSVVPRAAQVSRLGGDEFALVLPNCSVEAAEHLASGLLAAIREANLGHYSSRELSASVGIAFVRDSRTTVSDALACADDACYAAKASGRNRFSIFSEQSTLAAMSLNSARLASDTLDALDDGRMSLFGQEIHSLSRPAEQCRYVEVLARLTGRDGNPIAPREFIPAAERFGTASQLDRWVMKTALTRFSSAINSISGLTLAFNLSAQTVSDPKLWDFVDAVIDETGALPSNIVFEITETAAVTNFQAAENFIQNARERHCRVSLDDFGAKMSSFEYLRRFPIDSIKIDGSFVANMFENRFDREIVAAINGIAKALGYSVVAEKIEQEKTLNILKEMGVDYGQGYLLHTPEPLANIISRNVKQHAASRSYSK